MHSWPCVPPWWVVLFKLLFTAGTSSHSMGLCPACSLESSQVPPVLASPEPSCFCLTSQEASWRLQCLLLAKLERRPPQHVHL